MDPPWSLRIRDEAPLTIAAVVRGTVWILPDGADPRPMHVGDVALIRGPEHYTVADSPDTAPQVIIHPGQVCTTLDGVSGAEAMDQGVRTWGNSAQGATVVLTGTYQGDGEISRRVTDAPGSWSCSAMVTGTAPSCHFSLPRSARTTSAKPQCSIDCWICLSSPRSERGSRAPTRTPRPGTKRTPIR
jgi:hypothetical protein